jgi:hypothetical protein
VSLNFFCLIKLSKKLTEDVLKKDLALSSELGTTNAAKVICINVKKTEKINKKFMS